MLLLSLLFWPVWTGVDWLFEDILIEFLSNLEFENIRETFQSPLELIRVLVACRDGRDVLVLVACLRAWVEERERESEAELSLGGLFGTAKWGTELGMASLLFPQAGPGLSNGLAREGPLFSFVCAASVWHGHRTCTRTSQRHCARSRRGTASPRNSASSNHRWMVKRRSCSTRWLGGLDDLDDKIGVLKELKADCDKAIAVWEASNEKLRQELADLELFSSFLDSIGIRSSGFEMAESLRGYGEVHTRSRQVDSTRTRSQRYNQEHWAYSISQSTSFADTESPSLLHVFQLALSRDDTTFISIYAHQP